MTKRFRLDYVLARERKSHLKLTWIIDVINGDGMFKIILLFIALWTNEYDEGGVKLSKSIA